MDKYPGDVLAEIRKLRAEVDELRALLNQRTGLTSASQGWKIGNIASPPSPASGGHLYASGDDPTWKRSNGTVVSLVPEPPLPPAADVGGMSGLSTPNSWPASYNPATGGLVQDDLEMIRSWCLDFRANLRAAGHMA